MGTTAPLVPRGIRNNNPGNIRKGSERWNGLVPNKQQTDPAFWIFTDAKWGIRAIAVILMNYQRMHGLKTIRQMISRWAPAEDNNDTEAYIAAVAKAVGEDPNKPVSVTRGDLLRGMVVAIIWHENSQGYPPKVIDTAMALATQ